MMPEEFILPIEFSGNNPWNKSDFNNIIVIIGSESEMASVLIPHLKKTYYVIGIDVVKTITNTPHEYHQVDICDKENLFQVIPESSIVINLSTGVKQGWDGLVHVEIEGTKTLLEICVQKNIQRVIHMSSSHTMGWYERLWIQGEDHIPVIPNMYPRSDGLYGIAKSTAELMCRYVSDSTKMPITVLRVGTFRQHMTKQELINSQELPYLGYGEKREERLHRTWLEHQDLCSAVDEELQRIDRFTLKYLTSSPEQYQWNHIPLNDN